MSITIRILGPDDAPLLNHVAPDVFDQVIDPRWTAEFLNDPRYHLAVALDGEGYWPSTPSMVAPSEITMTTFTPLRLSRTTTIRLNAPPATVFPLFTPLCHRPGPGRVGESALPMLTLRRYQSSDQETVWELHTIALVQTSAYISSGAWDDDLHHIEEVYGGEFMVGLIEGQIVAMGALKRTSAERAAIKRMRVHPDHQGRGYGQTMLRYLEDRARVLGYKTLHLSTTDRQLAAQGLYLKNGYREIARKPLDERTLISYEKDL